MTKTVNAFKLQAILRGETGMDIPPIVLHVGKRGESLSFSWDAAFARQHEGQDAARKFMRFYAGMAPQIKGAFRYKALRALGHEASSAVLEKLDRQICASRPHRPCVHRSPAVAGEKDIHPTTTTLLMRLGLLPRATQG